LRITVRAIRTMETAASSPSRICRLVDWMPPRWLLLVLFCAALIVRGRFMLAHPEAFSTDPDGYGAVAWFIDQERMFATDVPMLRPTAARPPLYPLVLSMNFTLGLALHDACGALHVLLGTLTVWGVWHLGRQWKLPPGAGLVAAALVTVDPILLAHSIQLMTETLATFLAVMALIAVTHFARENSILWALGSGLSAALCVLCRPEFLVWLVVVAIAFGWLADGSRRAARVAIYLVAAMATIAPWGVRNLYVFGRPIITTTHGGFTLLLANNPDYYEHLRSAPRGSVWNGESIYRQWQDRQLGSLAATPASPVVDEVANDRWAYGQAFQNIRAEPGMFAWSCLVRVGRLWNVLPHQTSADESTARRGMRWAVAIWYAFEFALAAAGAWFLRGKLFAAPWVWGTLLVLSITAVHAFYWTDMRMRAPLTSVVALAAAYGLTELACRKPAASRLPPAA
jgi:Dolichyl-phosphate-mannose-protein mannosyltransferase